MNTYISLVNYTDLGIKTIKDVPERIERSRARAKELGGEIKQIFLTMGAYDLVVISEFPDAEAMAKFALITAGPGNLRTTTLQAFPEDQFRSIVESLP